MDEATFNVLYDYFCQDLSQETIAAKNNDSRYNRQTKISKCVSDNGFKTGVAGFQSRQHQKFFKGMPREEFRRLLQSYHGNSMKTFDDFKAHVEKNRSSRRQSPRLQPEKQSPRSPAPQKPANQNRSPQHSPPSPPPESQTSPFQLKPHQLSPHQLTKMEAAGYTYDSHFGWVKPSVAPQPFAPATQQPYGVTEQIQRLTQGKDEQSAHAIVLEEGKSLLAEHVISQVNSDNLVFDVAVCYNHPYKEYQFITSMDEKVIFFKQKREYLLTYPSFNLMITPFFNIPDLEKVWADINERYLIPRGYHIIQVVTGDSLPQNKGYLVTLLCNRHSSMAPQPREITLAEAKGRLSEHVIQQVKAGIFEFDVALFGNTPNSDQTTQFIASLPDGRRMLLTFSSFNLRHTDIAHVNEVWLIPQGYRIIKVLTRDPVPGKPGIITTLTCEDLRKYDNINTPQDTRG